MSNNKDDAAGLLWKQLSRARKEKNTQFPGLVIKSDGNTAQGKKEVMQEIKKVYTDIANNSDKAAKEYYKPNYREHKAQEQKENNPKREFEKTKSKENNRKSNNKTQCDSKPTSKDIELAIHKSNKDRAPGKDNMQTKDILNGYDMLKPHLDSLFGAMWDLSHTPKKWQSAITKLLHKKGPTTNISNYRPITLLTALFKIWKRILNNKLTTIRDSLNSLSPLQSGSRSNHSPSWTIIVRKILTKKSLEEKPLEDKPTIFVLQVDLNKAYNRVNREILWTTLWDMGIKGLLWKAIISTYSHISEIIKIGNTFSDRIN